MFHLSRAAIEYAGTGTDLAITIKDMTIRYFEQYFAPWVVEQGGWVSLLKYCTFFTVDFSVCLMLLTAAAVIYMHSSRLICSVQQLRTMIIILSKSLFRFSKYFTFKMKVI